MSALQTDPVQLALFQQLAQATKAGGYAPTAVPNQRVPVSMSVVPPSAPANVPVASSVGGPSQNFPYPDDRHGFGRREPLNDRFNGPPRGRESYYDNREQRGGFRGAPRGRGRGRWDDRDRQYDRNRGPDWRPPPPGRNMQSRSRSPVGRNGRNVRPYSPPRNHQAHYPPAPSSPGNVPPANGPAGEKDEFGRDIRPRSPLEHSPAPSSRAPDLSPSRSASIPTEDRGSALPERRQHDAGSSSTTQHTIPPTAMSTSSSSTSSATPAVGLESFDLTKFDPTAPTSWEGLGKAWSVTHGYMPSQEELMQYVMTMNAAATFPIVSQYEEAPARQWQGDNWGRGEPRRGGRSRGYRGSFARGQDYGNGRGGFRGRGRQYEEDTDALTLVGGDDSTQYTVPISDQPQGQGSHDNPEAYEDPTFDSDEKSGGHMEKVGDGWVWKEAAGVA
ncbi:hypothetical protein BC835DRAFT_212383 [Cytidiella melzeri]|nr:hypothetical protein BC835DRAFT_212383 [Cytidiella melzeri]